MRFKLKEWNDKHGIGRVLSQPGRILLSAVLIIFVAVSLGQWPATIQAQKITEGDGYFAYAPVVMKSDCTRYVEQDNLLVMEIESTPPVEQWVAETNLPGYTGDSYYTWHGPNYFGNPGMATLVYEIYINNPGEFNFRLHNRHDFPEPTEENDVWVKMDNGAWVKVFSPIGGQWTWGTFFDFGASQANASYVLSAGPHTIYISARSAGFSIDRIHLHKNPANENTSLPVSDCI